MPSKCISEEHQDPISFTQACVNMIKLILIDLLTLYVKPVVLKNIKGSSLSTGQNPLKSDHLSTGFDPPPHLPDYTTFNVLFLYEHIRDNCPLLRPTQGWGNKPQHTNRLIGDDVERLRLLEEKLNKYTNISEIPDEKLENIRETLDSLVIRFQEFFRSKGRITRYIEELLKIEKTYFLRKPRDPPHLDDITVTTGKDTITLQVNCIELLFPHFHDTRWEKNDEKIDLTKRKFSGRGTFMEYLTIRSPNEEDRGTYTCKFIGGLRTLSRPVTLDVPTATISLKAIVYSGSESKLDCFISSCPPPEGMEWHESIDGESFCRIDTSQPKYNGSSVNPYQPYLLIPKTTLNDEQFYRALVWNKIGRSMTETVYLKVLPNFMCVNTKFNSRDRSITLSVSLKDESPLCKVFFWTKNGQKIKIHRSDAKYLRGSIHYPSLTIFNVTHDDTGCYELNAKHSLGTTTSDKIMLGLPDVFFARPEKKEDGSQRFKVKVKSTPAPCNVQWMVRKKNEKISRILDPNAAEYIGTTDSLTNPELVVHEIEHLESYCFQIEVFNVIGSTVKEIPEIERENDLFHQRTFSPTLKSLLNCVTDEMQLHPLEMSFAQELLDKIHKDKIISEIKSLSTEIIFHKTLNGTAFTEECGNVYVSEVDVICKKKQLCVIQKRLSEWNKILQENLDAHVRLILVRSKFLRVIEAKLKVYEKYKGDIESGNILIQHVFDDHDEIAKLCAYKKLNRMCGIVQSLRKVFYLKRLRLILNEASAWILTQEYIRKLCREYKIYDEENYVGSVYDSSHMFSLSFNVKKVKVLLVKNIAQELGKTLGSDILHRILQYMEMQIREELEIVLNSFEINLCNRISFTLISVLEPLLTSKIQVSRALEIVRTFVKPIDVNSEEWRDTVAKEIQTKIWDNKQPILDTILKHITVTSRDLEIFSEKLKTAKEKIQLIDQKTLIRSWQKRQEFRNIIGLHKYPSVLKCIAGIKNRKLTIKIFLSHDDKEAMAFFKHYDKIPEGTRLEFVNVEKKSKESLRAGKEKTDLSSFRITEFVRKELGQIIKNQGERIYASHSSIVGLGIGKMMVKNEIKPCIVLYSLDKDLIPFGEKSLPTCLEGWPCDIQEDIVMFGTCFDCRQITNPNPGCCIGLPSNGIGSVGFLVKSKETESETAGFLTAAHVAAENWIDLYFSNSFLSVFTEGSLEYEIVHPLLPNCHDFQIIGKVKESFCGNWGSNGTGIDAAFVQNYEPSKGEIRELQIAEGRFLNYDERPRVLKRGGTTGETEGLLVDDSFSVCLDQVANDNESDECGFYFFDRCFAVDSIDRPFFERGDSGSGVFLMESGVPTKPLGIAFAKHLISQKTAVCRIDEIVNAFNLCLYQYEESMETSC